MTRPVSLFLSLVFEDLCALPFLFLSFVIVKPVSLRSQARWKGSQDTGGKTVGCINVKSSRFGIQNGRQRVIQGVLLMFSNL